ncbi:hypothetical protein SeMB42_g03357 [Synchytrium endobioticum]|uniref:Uncharacterized protein n=1 Tax=Synchytrium endobioticum TaxID=286115 RepID=A0A507D901_9FUNG|nr:hypothetical protein SeMB42_g03357 [Synchytrium endobioticum]
MNQTDVISGFPMVLTLPAYADSLQHAPPSPDIVKQHRPKEALPVRNAFCLYCTTKSRASDVKLNSMKTTSVDNNCKLE